MSDTIYIPTVNDELKDFDNLFLVWQQVIESKSDLIFDFSKCYFLRPNAVAFLGGLIRLVEKRSQNITIKKDTVHKNLKMKLF